MEKHGNSAGKQQPCSQLGKDIPKVLIELRRAWDMRKAVTNYLLAKADVTKFSIERLRAGLKRKRKGGGRKF